LEGWPQAGVGCPLLGKHNTENIRNALRLCQALGLNMQKCIEAVGTFKGIERRLERHGPNVIDDFAHSPVKIAAALEAVSGEFAEFCAVWRPHGYTPLFQGLENFVEIFSNHWKGRDGSPSRPQDKLFILPVYFAGGTVNIKITSEQFVERLQAAGVPAEFAENFQTLEKRLLEETLPVLIMGARDPELPLFARRIAAVIG
jgi:UDP-N-acetylmuramate--alanine ligase